MSAPENLPAGGPRGSEPGVRPTVLAWVLSLGLYWPVWLWRSYSTLRRVPGATRVSPGRAAALAVLPAVNLLWTVLVSVDLPRAVRRARSRDAGEPPDTEMLTILLLAPLAAGFALALALGLSPLPAVLAAGYLAWPFELLGAIATERAMGALRPALAPRQRRRHVTGALAAGAVAVAAVAVAVAVLVGVLVGVFVGVPVCVIVGVMLGVGVNVGVGEGGGTISGRSAVLPVTVAYWPHNQQVTEPFWIIQ